MYNLANFKEKRLFEMNRQVPNETSDEYKARINRKWTTRETSDSHKLFNSETKLINMKELPELDTKDIKKLVDENQYIPYNPQSNPINELIFKINNLSKEIEELKKSNNNDKIDSILGILKRFENESATYQQAGEIIDELENLHSKISCLEMNIEKQLGSIAAQIANID